MKKIGIITFHSPYNYGSSLQNYALQQVLIELGFDPETINFRTEQQKEQYNYFKPINEIIDKKRILLKIAYAPYKKSLLRKYELFETFLSKELKLSIEVNTSEEVRALPSYDGYIVGSDQCWNLSAKDFNWSYFMEFAPSNVPKISYAISMGPHPKSLLKASEETKRRIAKALESYSAISTRDENTAEVVKCFSPNCKEIEIMPDPTLLVSKDVWRERITKTPIVEGKYIFLYNPYYNKEVYTSAKMLAKITGLKIVVSNTNPKAILHSKGFENHLAVGPWEFLNLIDNASYVVGRSFHLLVFSILFHKRFIAVEGMGDSRLSNLLKLTKLEKCASKDYNIEQVMKNFDSIDFSLVDRTLYESSMRAHDFLLRNCTSVMKRQ